MARFEDYADKYPNIRMERRDGILQITFHTNGDTLQWGEGPHDDFPQAYADIATDPENRVVIMTGTGDGFSPVPRPRGAPTAGGRPGTSTSSTTTANAC